jgi:tellurite resistance protein TehA-like permease
LAQVSNARIANGLATTLVAILVRLLELPADFLLRREARAHYPHVPAFYAFHFPLVSQLFAVDDIPTCLAFLDTMASPSSSSSPSSPPSSSSSSSLSSASSVGGVGGAYGLGGMPDIPANAMLASLCYHMLSVLSHLFKYPGTLKELVQYKKLSAFVGLFKPLSAGTERRKSNKQKATADRTP